MQPEESQARRAYPLDLSPGQLRGLIVVLSAALPLRLGISGLPLSTMAAAALIVVAAFRPPDPGPRVPRYVGAPFVALILWLVGSSTLWHGLEIRRSGNLLILLGLAWVLAQGRLHTPSVVVGLGLGWVAGIAQAVVTLPDSSYEGRLTGYFGDPNGAGFVIVTLGCVLVGHAVARGRWARLTWVVMAAATWLTVSRTSLFALVAATLWGLFGRRLGRVGSVAAWLAAWPVYDWLISLAQANGFFAERAGSDELRARLSVVEQQMTGQAGLRGLGLGSAQAQVDGFTLWFHNSFWALQVEGGLIAFSLLVVSMAALFWSFHQVPRARRNPWFEGAIAAGLICSLNIGFSLLSVSMATAVGLYLWYWRQVVPEPQVVEPRAVPLVSPAGR